MNKKPVFQENKFRSNDKNKRQFGEQKPRFADKPRRERNDRIIEKPSIWGGKQQITAHKATTVGEGEVKVRIKATNQSSQSKEKKTGPLSPRAPEKIRQNRAEEVKVYGELACLALFEHRPQDIVRLWVTQELSKKAGEMMSYLAENKKAYHVVKNDEMQRVTGTEHHGGICLLVKKRPPLSLTSYLEIPRKQDCIVVLEGVGNAANIGGVLKTLAFYGVQNLVTDNIDLVQSPASMRVADGGIEHTRLFETEHATIALDQLQQAGYQLVRASLAKQATPLNQVKFADKVAIILSENTLKDLDDKATNVQLSQSNPLATGLNIAVVAGVLLAKWYF
ncbi:RNA methyltransferase substrate-binding domain-containing protein [Gallibacterium salpingitidis]|uniref:rRNA methyltransferase n=1 Tax=Gallibacterium salpingitidis TaxID=505341 RepID=A0A1A7NR69_9PAST|nr:RNA methyltransferase substrate-binding domain-containing protein [Gallibacterium salpingitidis]OBW92707.1 rRNA methyltransferase [Gallibacterium salpingitidis]